MTLETMRCFLGWCTVFNAGLLLVWIVFFWLAHNWMYRIHSRAFKITVETFAAIHYAGMAAYKLAILLLNLIPYWAILAIQ